VYSCKRRLVVGRGLPSGRAKSEPWAGHDAVVPAIYLKRSFRHEA
jgi:hypothetical protein